MSLLYHTDLRTFLTEHYESRTAKNPAYSLRAFARDLDVCPTQLSRFLRGVKGLSTEVAEKILESFPLDPLQKKFLLTENDSQHARSAAAKAQAKKKAEEIKAVSYEVMKDDEFSVVSDWHHMAILALAELPEFRLDTGWISRRLGINVETAALAIDRMLGLGLVTRRGDQLEVNANYFANTKVQPREAARIFHDQVLEKAQASIQELSLSEREHQSLFLSVDSSRIDEARAFINEFRAAFDRKFSMQVPKHRKNAVFGFSIQYFQVSGPSTPATKAGNRNEPEDEAV